MAELVYFTGPMDCGKSTLALQIDHTQTAAGRRGQLFTSHDRAGEATVSSRLGLRRPAIEVDDGFDFWAHALGQRAAGRPLDYLICDESQFYTAAQIEQLARIVDELDVDVTAVGILTDFQTRLFPGSRRLVELCDRMDTLQVRTLCWCGRRATHNARTVDRVMVTEGDQVAVGNTGSEPGPEDDSTARGDVDYEVLCRRHHRAGLTRAARDVGEKEIKVTTVDDGRRSRLERSRAAARDTYHGRSDPLISGRSAALPDPRV